MHICMNKKLTMHFTMGLQNYIYIYIEICIYDVAGS